MSFTGMKSAAIALEILNFLVFVTVGVILRVRSYEMKAPKTKKFIWFTFFWAGSQLADIVSWILYGTGYTAGLQTVLLMADAAFGYMSYFLFLYILLMLVEEGNKLEEVWKYTLYIGLAAVVIVQCASTMVSVSNEAAGSMMNSIYLALSTVLLSAEFLLVVTNRKGLMTIEVCAISFYTIAELLFNLFIKDVNLRYAVLSCVGAVFSIMIFGAIIQRLILLNIQENDHALNRAYKARDKVEQTVKAMSQTMDKYLGHNVAELIMNDQIVHGESRQVVIFFADIEGFTSLCEGSSPEDVMSILNLFLETMTNAVLENDGIVDKFIGDCTMALWNAPLDQPDGPYLACRAALAIKNGVKVANQIIEKEYGLHLEVNTGISFGTAVIGNFGSSTRKSFTAVGDIVNVAARIQDLADHGEIFVTREIMESVGARGRFEKRDSVVLKGKSIPTEVYELVGMAE